jgi:hypothetical protein
VHCATIFSIYFRFLFAMMSGWEILGLASFHFVDSTGIRHSIEVAAESLYEPLLWQYASSGVTPGWMMWILVPSPLCA